MPRRPQICTLRALSFVVATSAAQAADIELQTSNGAGQNGFSAGTGWPGGTAPSAGNDYFVTNKLLRTAADGASATFAGASLTLRNSTPDFAAMLSTPAAPNTYGTLVLDNGAFMFKGTTKTATINNLILDGGVIRAGESTNQTFTLAGNLGVAADGGAFHAEGAIVVSALVSGSGSLTVLAGKTGVTNRTVSFTNANNTFNGDIIVQGGGTGTYTLGGLFTLANTGRLNFEIGADGVCNSVSGGGAASFNGTFFFDLSGADLTDGNSWTIVGTADKSYGGAFNVAGFTDNLDDTWSYGGFTFSEATGILTYSAIPEPSSFAALAGVLALGAVAAGRRRRTA